MTQGLHLLAHDDVTDVIAGDFSSMDSVRPANCRQRGRRTSYLAFGSRSTPNCRRCTPFGGGDPVIAQPGGEGCSNGSAGLQVPTSSEGLTPIIVKSSGNADDDCMPIVEPLTNSLGMGRRAVVRSPFPASP